MDQYIVTGMSCAACSARVEKAVSAVPGVQSCSVSLLTNSMGVEGTASSAAVIKAVTDAGYGASLKKSGKKTRQKEEDSSERIKPSQSSEMKESTGMKKRLIASLIFLLPLLYVSMGNMMFGWPLPGFLNENHIAIGLYELLLSAIVMVINQKFFISGFKGLMHRAPNMDTLVALGATASFGYSVYALFAMTEAMLQEGHEAAMAYMDEFYFESAAMILTLITVGKMLEARSKGKTTDALKGLMKLAPKTAVLLREGEEVKVSIQSVRIGDRFIVRAGDSIPVDGVVIEGNSAVDEAALTGESIPVDKAVGDSVSAATINQSGYLICEATRVGEDTTLSQIIQMVSDAAATKAPIAKIADRVSGVFVPVVISIAAVTFLIWMIAGETVGFALARAISVLVISCPCALGLATPVAIMVGNGIAAKNGIMFKTAVSLEETGKTQIVVLDKTGTITEGKPVVKQWIPADGIAEEELLEYAGALEKMSAHPLAKAVVEACEQNRKSQITLHSSHSSLEHEMQNESQTGVQNEPKSESQAIVQRESHNESGLSVTDFREEAGNGLIGVVNGTKMLAGNRKFISKHIVIPDHILQQSEELAQKGMTPLFFARNNQFFGLIAVADSMKSDSAEAIAQLHRMGVHTVMLTGDNAKTAKAIGEQAGVDEVIAGVLPDGKEEVIRILQEKGKVIMVGDGINDAPALTRADIGIAIGAGTDVAIDAADVVLMKSSLRDVAAAIRISRATLRNIRQNLFWAFFYNIIGIPLAAGLWIPIFGWTLNPMFGAAAMSLSSFCVVSNALRLNLLKVYQTQGDRELKNTLGHAPLVTDFIQNKEEREMEIKVKGMMCGHCEMHVKKALEKIDGIVEATANHDTGLVVITTDKEVSMDAIKAAITDEGYEFLG